MAPNKSLVLAKNPTGVPIPGEDLVMQTAEIDLDSELVEGSVLAKTLYLSYDPFQRGRMRPITTKSYINAYPVGTVLHNAGILTILKSNNTSFSPGQLILGNAFFSEYQVINKEHLNLDPYKGGFYPLQNPLGLDLKVFLGALGMPGLTAYSSFYEIGRPKKGETIFISAASGAVGQIVGQLAKREGMKVLGSVGSQEKLDYITKELGFDMGFNYKAEGVKEGLERILKESGAGDLNVYYDNVGGPQLDAALENMANFGRVVQCGSISQTSIPVPQQYGIKNMPQVVFRRLTLSGFIVLDPHMGPKYAEEHQQNMQKWIKDGSIVVKTHVTEGMDNAAQGLVGMLNGENFGKAVLKVADV